MNEIFEPISQGKYGEEVEEDGSMGKALTELKRRSEEDGRNAQATERTLLRREEIKSHIAEKYAKENGMWIPIEETFSLGEPAPGGNENDVYFRNVIISDLRPRNVLKDSDNDFYVVDTEFEKNNIFDWTNNGSCG